MKKLLPVAVVAGCLVSLTAVGLAQQPTAPPSASAPSSTVQLEAKSLIGSTVRTQDGKDIGKVTNVMIDPKDGKVSGIVMSMGSKLGMGGSQMTVPWDAVQIARDQQTLVVTLQQQVMPTAPPRQDSRGGKSGENPAASPSTGSPSPGSQSQSK
jgi:sporulation protein YlmC with PRC-barrel domain